jgi:hypothetical protein
VRASGRSKWLNSTGALQVAGGTAFDVLACGKAAGVIGRGTAATAGVAAGIAAGAAARVRAGATKRAGSIISACAAAKVAKTAEAAAARATRAIIKGLLGDINVSFAFCWRPDARYR